MHRCTCHKNVFSECAYCRDLPARNRAEEKREEERERNKMKAYKTALAAQGSANFRSGLEELNKAQESGSKIPFSISYKKKGKKNRKSSQIEDLAASLSLGGGNGAMSGNGTVSRSQKFGAEDDSESDDDESWEIRHNC